MTSALAAPLDLLSDRFRPETIDDFVGQEHLLGAGRPLRRAIESGSLHSLIFWGPPGTGKTSLARVMARHSKLEFVAVSAVLAGVKEVRTILEAARERAAAGGSATLLFVDELHRFNKSQQDVFLPVLEEGVLVLIGATTENPSFEINKALLSRVRVYRLEALSQVALVGLLGRALGDSRRGLGSRGITADHDVLDRLAKASDGDARRALTLCERASELAAESPERRLKASLIDEVLRDGYRRFDKRGEDFYDQISALHKAVRGSSVDGALYWLARMLDGGVDPVYVARRLVRAASEDIGNADPQALTLALRAWEVVERLGLPEAKLALAQAALYLAAAPKSNAVYRALARAEADVARHGALEVPLTLRNAPTGLMREEGYGAGYRYPHDEPDAYAADVSYLPPELRDARYYEPTERGVEGRIRERLARLRERDEDARRDRKES